MIDNLYNQLFNLCEIRGQLDDADNARLEAMIAEVNQKIKALEAEKNNDFS